VLGEWQTAKIRTGADNRMQHDSMMLNPQDMPTCYEREYVESIPQVMAPDNQGAQGFAQHY